jgi:hypothetical protein
MLVLILLIAAAICFLFESFSVALGTLAPKWWALGVALLILAQVHFPAL